MNKLFFICTVVALVTIVIAGPTEYRNFTNQDGKTIVARVTDYDADAGKVQLELKNRRKAWVELSALSEVDQFYIQGWHQENSREADPNAKEFNGPLSNEQIEVIAGEYTKAIQTKNYTAFSDLIADPTNVSEECFFFYYDSNSRTPSAKEAMRFRYVSPYNSRKGIEIHSVGEGYAIIEFQYEGRNVEGILLFLPDGKIKYDAIFHQHPMILAHKDLTLLKFKRLEGINREMYSRTLTKTGIPLFEYDSDSSDEEQQKALDKMWTWSLQNMHDWDADDPKVFLPKKFTDLLGWDYLSQLRR